MSLHVYVCQYGHLALTDTKRTYMNDCPACYVDGQRGEQLVRVPGTFMLIRDSQDIGKPRSSGKPLNDEGVPM